MMISIYAVIYLLLIILVLAGGWIHLVKFYDRDVDVTNGDVCVLIVFGLVLGILLGHLIFVMYAG